jgi:hypothetical protein
MRRAAGHDPHPRFFRKRRERGHGGAAGRGWAVSAGLAVRAALIALLGLLLGSLPVAISVILCYYGVLFLLGLPFPGLARPGPFDLTHTIGCAMAVIGLALVLGRAVPVLAAVLFEPAR